ncbi:hypothetical protein [Methylosinus sporium]|uniref:Uncharacterized protein n=1 Tax=Methylosinus sporium TaxID=428 RepID=A0A2U1SSQ8_METSR|nr:hypothetical protein [Methylosinus sporium]PWB94632.1 hypothetical protein C5689_06100 [Methylosinus sporium]
MSRSPIDVLFGHADMRCTICGAPAGACSCWTRCACGWTYETGKACRNPNCTVSPRVTIVCPTCGRSKHMLPDPSDPPRTARILLDCPKCIRGATTTIEYFDAEGNEIDG